MPSPPPSIPDAPEDAAAPAAPPPRFPPRKSPGDLVWAVGGYVLTVAAFNIFAVGVTGAVAAPLVMIAGFWVALFFGWSFVGAVMLMSVFRKGDGTGEVMLFFMILSFFQWAWLAGLRPGYSRLWGDGGKIKWRLALTSVFFGAMAAGSQLGSYGLRLAPGTSARPWLFYGAVTAAGLAWLFIVRRRARKHGQKGNNEKTDPRM